MSNILIASLGDSPVVVSSMYDLLTKRENLKIDEVVVLHPQAVGLSYDLVEEALQTNCSVRAEVLPFEDADTEKKSLIFLQKLYTLIQSHQTQGNTIYLSLAGGRKSMSALIAWVVPFCTCVKGLYHVLAQDEDHFMSIEDMVTKLTEKERLAAMHPDISRLRLIHIPFSEEQQIRDTLQSRLLTIGEEEEASNEEEEASTIFFQIIANGDKPLDVYLTKPAVEQFAEMCKHDTPRAKAFKACFEKMRSASQLRYFKHIRLDDVHDKSAPGKLHFFKRRRTTERPVFYTRPKDIHACPDKEVEEVVVCALEIKKENDYRSLKKITNSSGFSWEPFLSLDLLPTVGRHAEESILIVPLGKRPMIATQLYTLLKTQEGRNIREVVLIYPQRETLIRAGAILLDKVFREEGSSQSTGRHISCKQAQIPKLEDINTTEACLQYQQTIEDEIGKALQRYTKHQILLALSGGRKGMTAMTIFAAQKKGIPHVYHTLITDNDLEQKIDKETTIKMLNSPSLRRGERNDRLFLRAYEGTGPYSKFALFRVPVLPYHDE